MERQANMDDQKINPDRFKKLPIIDVNNPSKKYSEKEEKFLREVVNYEFSNIEEPGVMVKFSYGCRGAMERFTLFHGNQYKLPRFIARHIESRGVPLWKWMPSGDGRLAKQPAGRKPRFQMREVYA
ncbi:MAG: hypothetical protein R3230_01205 [Nitrosopumilaceae archaeon]|nr:hypothetical protein [Nitrosopumilaceae archaeon]